MEACHWRLCWFAPTRNSVACTKQKFNGLILPSAFLKRNFSSTGYCANGPKAASTSWWVSSHEWRLSVQGSCNPSSRSPHSPVSILSAFLIIYPSPLMYSVSCHSRLMHDIALRCIWNTFANVIRGLPRLPRDISGPHDALKEQQIWNYV